jgi:NTE family protein
MTAIGLVLGAGGAVGAAYHAGVLAALAEATGWDARTAPVIVGTSAGSGIAASLRAGLSPADHLARALGQPLSPAGIALMHALPAPIELPTRPSAGGGLRPPASLGALTGPLRHGHLTRPGVAFAGLVPRGTIPTDPMGDAVRTFHPQPWPDQPTWICAVRLDDGARVVFGRDDVRGAQPDLGAAVQASSAVPGFFSPVTIGDHEYVDGGVHSSTNADLLGGLGLDVVVVVAPMAAVPRALGRSVNAFGRILHARTLRHEVHLLRVRRLPVLVIQPTSDDLREMGINAMDRSRRSAVAARARLSVLNKLERPDAHELVASLADAAATAPSTSRP